MLSFFTYPNHGYLFPAYNTIYHAPYDARRMISQQQRAIIKNIPITSRTTSTKITTTTRSTTPNLTTSTSRQGMVGFATDNHSNNPSALYKNVHMDEMEHIIDEYEKKETSEYVVIDVRTDEEVLYTGKISPSVYTLPVQVISQYNVFSLNDDDFEDTCGFAKPDLDQTIVFTCKAGIRSVYACQIAAQSGYTKLINYVGGSSEWFTKHRPQ